MLQLSLSPAAGSDGDHSDGDPCRYGPLILTVSYALACPSIAW
jgi:hypothetical protein